MTTLSHLTAGLVVGQWFIKKYPQLGSNLPFTYFVSLGSANLPDIDVLLFGKLYDHRDHSPFHYPFTWWVAYVTAVVAVFVFEIRWLLPYIYLSLANVFLHLVLDTFGVNAGILWFGPFFKKEYSFLRLRKRPTQLRDWVYQYATHWIMLLELAIWIVGFVALKKIHS